MMPSPPIDDRYDTCHNRWLAAGRHQAHIHPLDRPVTAPQIRSCNARTARSPRCAHPWFAEDRPRQPLQSTLIKLSPAAKDAMRRTKAALVFLRSPSSHQQRKETCKWIMQLLVRQPRLSSTAHWS
jgi:hypothetical protein